MLPKLWVAVLSCFISLSALAQDNDSLYVVSKESKCYLEYTVKPGETLFMLAKRYHCPPALLADANGLTYRNAIKDSTTIYIPLGDYNFLKTKPEHVRLSQIRRIFHKAASGETDIFSISRNVGVSRDNLQQWNKGYDMIKAGDVLLVGWVVYDETQVPGYKAPVKQVVIEDVPKNRNPNVRQAPEEKKPVKAEEKPKSKIQVADEDTKNGKKGKPSEPAKEIAVVNMDTSKYKTGEAEQTYLSQTHNETKVNVEKGPAVFFDMPGGHSGAVFLGFHSGVPRGTIIKVYNPGTAKAIFVKILGPLPETKQYYNSIMGINSDAKEALGVKEGRIWCEMTFGGN